MAEADVTRLKLFIKELDEYTTQIQRRKTVFENNLGEIRAVWNDAIFLDYLNKYNTLSRDIDAFINRSKMIQNGLNSKVTILTRYLNGRR